MASSSSAETKLATAKTVLSTAGSVAATAMLVRSIAQDFLPHEIQHYFFSGISSFFSRFSSQLTMVIEEFDGLVNNQIYEAAEIYLGSKVSPSTHRIKVSKPEKENNFTITMESNQEIVDVFNGVKFNWILVSRQVFQFFDKLALQLFRPLLYLSRYVRYLYSQTVNLHLHIPTLCTGRLSRTSTTLVT